MTSALPCHANAMPENGIWIFTHEYWRYYPLELSLKLCASKSEKATERRLKKKRLLQATRHEQLPPPREAAARRLLQPVAFGQATIRVPWPRPRVLCCSLPPRSHKLGGVWRVWVPTGAGPKSGHAVASGPSVSKWANTANPTPPEVARGWGSMRTFLMTASTGVRRRADS